MHTIFGSTGFIGSRFGQWLDARSLPWQAPARGDDALHVGDVEAIARGRIAIDVDVDVAAAGKPLRQGRLNARHVP